MATASTPAPSAPITLAVLTPITADVAAVAGAVTAVCTLLATPAGQKLLDAEIAAGVAVETAVSNFFGKIFNGIGGLLAKVKL